MSAEIPQPEQLATVEQAQRALVELDRILALTPKRPTTVGQLGSSENISDWQSARQDGVGMNRWGRGVTNPMAPDTTQFANVRFPEDGLLLIFSVEKPNDGDLQLKRRAVVPRTQAERIPRESFNVESPEELIEKTKESDALDDEYVRKNIQAYIEERRLGFDLCSKADADILLNRLRATRVALPRA